MQIATYYKEVYQNIGQTIAVPKALQNQKVEVHFLPVSVMENPDKDFLKPLEKNNNLTKKNTGLGTLMRSYFEDIPPAKNEAEKLVMPIREIEPAVEFK